MAPRMKQITEEEQVNGINIDKSILDKINKEFISFLDNKERLKTFLKEQNKLIESWFNYNYIVKGNYNDSNDNDDNQDNNDEKEDDEWIHNKYKYVFISANKDTEIIIYKASIYSNIPDENERIIAVKLQKNQSLILPFKWKYYINNYKDINTWGIHDLITFSVGLFF